MRESETQGPVSAMMQSAGARGGTYEPNKSDILARLAEAERQISALCSRSQAEMGTDKDVDFTDPSDFSEVWNLNTMTVATCKAMVVWPKDHIWNPDDRVFEPALDLSTSTNSKNFKDRRKIIWSHVASLVPAILAF
jgi:hypothetical protein